MTEVMQPVSRPLKPKQDAKGNCDRVDLESKERNVMLKK